MRISDYVSDVIKASARLNAPPVLVGHSMGGLVVQKYLEKYPAPAAVLLASLPVGGLRRSIPRIFTRHPWLFLKANLTRNLHSFVRTKELIRESFFSDNIDGVSLAKYAAQIKDESYFAFLDMLLLNLPRPEKITTPILVMGAEKDRFFFEKQALRTAKAYHTKALIVEHVAHDMMLERDWQKAADIIISWLKERDLS